MQPTRRQALAAGAVALAAASAGCTTDRHPSPPVRTTDDALREAAVARERELVDAYAAALLALPRHAPRLAELLADHNAHLARLGAAAVPSTTPPATTPAVSLRTLAAREHATGTAHAAAALTASRELAALLASLAACEASHAVVL